MAQLDGKIDTGVEVINARFDLIACAALPGTPFAPVDGCREYAISFTFGRPEGTLFFLHSILGCVTPA